MFYLLACKDLHGLKTLASAPCSFFIFYFRNPELFVLLSSYFMLFAFACAGPSYRNTSPIYLLLSSQSIPNQLLKQTSHVISSSHTPFPSSFCSNVDNASCASLLLGHPLLHFPQCIVVISVNVCLVLQTMNAFRYKTHTHLLCYIYSDGAHLHSDPPPTLRFHMYWFRVFHKNIQVQFIYPHQMFQVFGYMLISTFKHHTQMSHTLNTMVLKMWFLNQQHQHHLNAYAWA